MAPVEPRTPGDIEHKGESREGGRAVRRRRPGGGGAPAPGPGAGGRFQLQSPRYVRPPRGRDFTVTAVQTGRTSTNTPAALQGSDFSIPLGTVGVIRSLVFNVNDLLTSSEIYFSLRINQGSVQGFHRYRIFPRSAASISESFGPEEFMVDVPETGVVDVLVEVVDAGSYTLGATFHGWFFDSSLYDAVEAAWRR